MEATDANTSSHAVEQTARPYGLIGLCASLIVAMIFTVLLMGLVAATAYLVMVLRWGASTAKDTARFLLDLLQMEDQFGVGPLTLGLLSYIAATLSLFGIARWRGGGDWRLLVAWQPPTWPLRDKALWGIAALGLVYGVASSAALGYYYPKSNTWLMLPRNHLAALMLFILAVILAPIAEETYFRGWIFTSLRFRLGLWPAAIISALLFALAHYESTHLYALAVFPLGLILAALRARTGSARTSMLFHAANNLIAFLSAGVGGS